MSDTPNPDLETQESPAPPRSGGVIRNSVIGCLQERLSGQAALQAVASSAETKKSDALRVRLFKGCHFNTAAGGELDNGQTLRSEGNNNSIVLETSRIRSKPNIPEHQAGDSHDSGRACQNKVARMIKTAETSKHRSRTRMVTTQVYNNTTRMRRSIHRKWPARGLPAAEILEFLRGDVEDIRDGSAAWKSTWSARVCLILYESDAVRAEEGLKWLLQDEEEEEEDSDDDEDEEDDPNKPSKRYTPYDVRLIDLTHALRAWARSGRGAPQVLKTLLALFRREDRGSRCMCLDALQTDRRTGGRRVFI
ncbi:Kinase [Mycena sanguinolenta]|uniref:Kinase n=1 Tax=Mycena sanguinolenta TaxID=230812 RepID=A0A8H7CT83_9AGAR|nr:Kinase [Mycena sanguinolenta]